MEITVGTKVKIEAVKSGANGNLNGSVGVVEQIYDDGVAKVKVGEESVEATSVSFIAAPEPAVRGVPAKPIEPEEPVVEEAPVQAAPQPEVEEPAAAQKPIEEPKPKVASATKAKANPKK